MVHLGNMVSVVVRTLTSLSVCSKFHSWGLGHMWIELVGPWARFSKVPKTFRARKAICETVNRLFWKADLLT